MKKLLFLSIAACSSVFSFATIRTVNNGPGITIGSFVFSTIQNAVNASLDGDTILVAGSNTSYAGFTIADKKIILIGPGISPTRQIPLTADINTPININNTSSPGSPNGTEIQGIRVFQSFSIASSAGNGYSNIKIHRCRIDHNVNINENGVTYNNITFESNWLNNAGSNTAGVIASTSSTYGNIFIQNNFFICNTNNNSSIQGFTNISTGVLVNHNLFTSSTVNNTNTPVFGGNCVGVMVANNIFVNRNPVSGISQSTFSNNITFNCGGATNGNTPWLANLNIDGGGNIGNTSPQIVDQTLVNSASIGTDGNFTIAVGSPAKGTGTLGSDMGLFFETVGPLNWTNSVHNSLIPYINSMVVNNVTVAPGGNVSVTVEAKKAN
jgi:hypothetical protein